MVLTAPPSLPVLRLFALTDETDHRRPRWYDPARARQRHDRTAVRRERDRVEPERWRATTRKAHQRVGARHARKSASADFLRVAPLPPRKKARGAFDPPCAPWPEDGVGTKGVPTFRRALAALRRTKGRDLLAATP